MVRCPYIRIDVAVLHLTSYLSAIDATGATFKGAILKGSRFYRANLKDVDFSNAYLSTASLEDTLLQNVDFTNANLEVLIYPVDITYFDHIIHLCSIGYLFFCFCC